MYIATAYFVGFNTFAIVSTAILWINTLPFAYQFSCVHGWRTAAPFPALMQNKASINLFNQFFLIQCTFYV